MKKRIFFVLGLFAFFLISFIFLKKNSKEKNILLLSTPRSLGTAFYRSMQNRGDFEVLMEPLTYFKYKFPEKSQDDSEMLRVLKEAFNSNHDKSLFVKEMAYQIPLNEDFLNALPPETKVVLLVREPSQAVMSYFKEFLKEGYDTEFTRPEFTMDYGRFEKALQFFREKSSLSIKVLDAENLILEPEKTLHDFDKWAGLESRKGALTWKLRRIFLKKMSTGMENSGKARDFLFLRKDTSSKTFPKNLDLESWA